MEKFKKPTKKQINEVFEIGCSLQGKIDQITPIIIADVCNADENNQTQITKTIDKILASDDEEMKADVKRFVGKSLQTLIKEKPTQEQLLGEDASFLLMSVKKVNKSMVENKDGRYIHNYNESDLGSYRVVLMEKKEKKDLSLAQELAKWMRSQKKNQLFRGTKADAKELTFYEFDLLKATIDNIERGIEEI
tara:strand:+ start:1670 stop:2245 length:576 start_codon:yes stop_codon:yes gene_type:complete